MTPKPKKRTGKRAQVQIRTLERAWRLTPREPVLTRATVAFRVDMLLRNVAEAYEVTGGEGDSWATMVAGFARVLGTDTNNGRTPW